MNIIGTKLKIFVAGRFETTYSVVMRSFLDCKLYTVKQILSKILIQLIDKKLS